MTQPASKRLVSEARLSDITTAATNAGIASAQSQINSSAAAAASSATAAQNSANLVGAPADTAIATAVSGTGTQTRAALKPLFVGKVTGLVANDTTPSVKTANAAVLTAALTAGAPVTIPSGTYYTDTVSITGPATLQGEDATTTALRNDTGSVLILTGTQINVSRMTIRSGGGNHTIRQSGNIDQGSWRDVRLWQEADGYSIWNNGGFGLIDMRFSNFLSWHTQTATVPSWNLVATGQSINNNVWREFRAQFSGNYHFWVESTDINCHHSNVWRDATWEVTTGGMIKLIGCRDYLIDNSTVWDLGFGTGGVTTLKRHGIFADTNAANALCIGSIRHHRRLDSACDAGVYDIKLPSGTSRGAGTLLERCQNITSANPLVVDMNSNDALVINPGTSASTLTTYANSSATQFINKDGMSLPSTQAFKVSGVSVGGLKATASISGLAAIAAGGELTFTITVTGALVGDSCIATTRSLLETGLTISAWAVTAADTVTVRLRNYSAASITPIGRTWDARVWR